MTLISLIQPTVGEAPRSRSREFQILAQDPAFMDARGNPLVAKVTIPFVRVDAGPRSHRVNIVDYDVSMRELADSVDLEEDRMPADPSQVAAPSSSWSNGTLRERTGSCGLPRRGL